MGRHGHLTEMNAETRHAARNHLAPVMAEVDRMRADDLSFRECAERLNAAGFRSRLRLPFTERSLMVAYRRFKAQEQTVPAD